MVGPSKPKFSGKFSTGERHEGKPEGPTGCIRCEKCLRLIDIHERDHVCKATYPLIPLGQQQGGRK
jgi:hypothetical protein